MTFEVDNKKFDSREKAQEYIMQEYHDEITCKDKYMDLCEELISEEA